MALGNINPKIGEPVMETLTLNENERIVGVKF